MLFGRGGFWVDYWLRHGRYRATSEPDDWFNFRVSGPNALYVVEKGAGQSIRDIAFMYSGKIPIADHEVVALRQGMAGEVGYELQGPSEYARHIYEAILEAAKEFGIRRLGGRAAFINISKHASRRSLLAICLRYSTTTCPNIWRSSKQRGCPCRDFQSRRPLRRG